jgi:hypothetical protein
MTVLVNAHYHKAKKLNTPFEKKITLSGEGRLLETLNRRFF